jgi:hypothetical protein
MGVQHAVVAAATRHASTACPALHALPTGRPVRAAPAVPTQLICYAGTYAGTGMLSPNNTQPYTHW